MNFFNVQLQTFNTANHIFKKKIKGNINFLQIFHYIQKIIKQSSATFLTCSKNKSLFKTK